MKTRSLLFIILGLLIFSSCSEDTSETLETENFTRIYDNNSFNDSYSPIDVIQTDDGGFIVLATLFKPDAERGAIYLLKADKAGIFVKDLALEETFTNPLKGMFIKDSKVYFVCINNLAQTALVSVDLGLTEATTTDVALTYPSAAAYVDNELLILSYDQIEKKTVFSKVALSGSVTVSRLFDIADDDSLEDEVLKHFLRTGKQFPFQVGRIPGGTYFFNGFSDYTFSLVFTNLGDDNDIDGVIQGQQDNAGFNSITALGSTNFAVSYFSFGSTYILPKASLATTGEPTSIVDLTGLSMPEFVPNGAVQILRATQNGRNVLLYVSSTRSKQIGVYMYDESNGAFLGSKYFGFSNPYEAGHVIQTSDGGLLVAGTTYIAGRFPRICVIKLSAEQFSSINQQQ
jgi:hypothetical protein